jgi:hypothetical protein
LFTGNIGNSLGFEVKVVSCLYIPWLVKEGVLCV